MSFLVIDFSKLFSIFATLSSIGVCVIKENKKNWIKFSVWANIRMEIAASSTGWRFTDYRLGKIVQVEDVSYSSQDLPGILCLSKISLWAKNISCSWSTLHSVMSDQTKICTLLNLCQYLTLEENCTFKMQFGNI